MSDAAPPAWVKALALPSGQWRFLVTAWGWGPFSNASADAKPLAKPVKVTSSIRKIGARSGQSRATAAKQSLALCAAGWMRREPDDSLTLASWRFPHIFDLEAAVDEGIVIRDGDGALSWREMRCCPGDWLPDGRSKCAGPNCSRCTGSGLVAVTRSQLASLDGSTEPAQGSPRTAQWSDRRGVGPTPHTVHPRTAQGRTHPPGGPRSCSSSLSSSTDHNSMVHAESTQDPHESTPPTSTTPIAPPTPEARPPQVNDDPTSTECDDGATGSTLDMFGNATTPAKRDLAAEVFAHLVTRIIATKRDLGISPATGPRKLHAGDRKSIESRITDHGGGDEGLQACKRVIEIDEAECRAQGRSGKGWGYWNAKTPFRPTNFDQRLDRWREDGDHALMTRTNGKQRRGPNVSGYDLHKEFPCDGT